MGTYAEVAKGANWCLNCGQTQLPDHMNICPKCIVEDCAKEQKKTEIKIKMSGWKEVDPNPKVDSGYGYILEDWKKLGELLKESDPNGKSAKEPGSKLDAGKPPIMQGVFQYFPRALKAVSEVSEVGAKKYTWNGWETVPDGINRYGNALGRHLVDESIDGSRDIASGCLHAAQVAWNALARLELILREEEKQCQK